MGTNPFPLTTLQLTSPLPSPSATPGRPVIGGDDQVSAASSGNSNNDHTLTNAATLSTIEGGGGGGRGRGGVVGNNNNKRNTICLQLPPAVSNIDNDRLVPCYHNDNQQNKTHRRSLPPLVFNPPLTHGDAIYPLANLPTPSMLRQLPFTMPGARGIFEEIDSSDGQVSVQVTSDMVQSSNQSPRKRPVSWFSKEEDWETNLRCSKRTESSVKALGPITKQEDQSGENKHQIHHQHQYNHHAQQMDITDNDNSNNDNHLLRNEQLFPLSSSSSSSNMFPPNIQFPFLSNNNDNNISTCTTDASSPVVSATCSYSNSNNNNINNYNTIDNSEESPNSALPSPSLSPLSSGPQDIVWSQTDTNNSPDMIPLDKQEQQQSPQPQQVVVSKPHQQQKLSRTCSPTLSPTTINSMPLSSPTSMFDTYAQLPQNIQNYFLVHLLRRSPMSALRLSNSAILHALRMDIITRLSPSLTHRILRLVDFSSLCRATSVSRKWKQIIDNDFELWQHKFTEARYVVTAEEAERYFTVHCNQALAYKELYRRHYRMQLNWKYNQVKRLQLTAHPNNVVTCLQFDDDKIITGSDDYTVNIYDIKTGKLRRVLRGHDGGVWALQYIGNTLVTGSTDRTIKVWDIDTGECRETFSAHMSTVRCLTIVMPTRTRAGHMEPQQPMLVSGSRDTTLQVWMLPTEDQNQPYLQRRRRHSIMPLYHKTESPNTSPLEPMSTDSDDPMTMMSGTWNDFNNGTSNNSNSNEISGGEDFPGQRYHVHTLTGHTMSVRDLAAHGNILASGSYDNTVRLWHLEMGQLRHVLVGHEQKVYSVVIDAKRNRCISGSMDSTVRIWSIVDGSCLHVLGGHTILVGLLGLTDSYLVSAAADQTLRIWSPDDGERQHVLTGHQGAITSFQHDEHKVVSGSEGGLKMWDVKTGKLQHDLIKNVSGVWRVAFDERRCVAAVKCADNITRLEILDYGIVGLE